MRREAHGGFGERPGETDREQSRHRAPGRLNRWRDGTMALRWCAAGMLEADHQFRRVNGRLHLPKLRATLETHFNQNVGAGCHDETVSAA